MSAELTDRELSKLSRSIARPSMKTIAIEFLDFKIEQVTNLGYYCGADDFNLDVLNKWSNRFGRVRHVSTWSSYREYHCIFLTILPFMHFFPK